MKKIFYTVIRHTYTPPHNQMATSASIASSLCDLATKDSNCLSAITALLTGDLLTACAKLAASANSLKSLHEELEAMKAAHEKKVAELEAEKALVTDREKMIEEILDEKEELMDDMEALQMEMKEIEEKNASLLEKVQKTRYINLATGTKIFVKCDTNEYFGIWNNENQTITWTFDGKTQIFTYITPFFRAVEEKHFTGVYYPPRKAWYACYVKTPTGNKTLMAFRKK